MLWSMTPCYYLCMVKLSNSEVVIILKEALAAMEVKGSNTFEIRAYQNAISVIDNLTSSVYDLYENKRLGEIAGVGKILESHLIELFSSGKVAKFEALKKDLPQGMFALIGIRGVGAKKAFKLAAHFKLNDRTTALEKIKSLATEGKIRELDGFGEKSEKDILDAISGDKLNKNKKERLLLSQAEQISERITDYMKKLKSVEKLETLGSLRRRNSTVGDLDLAVGTQNGVEVLDYFAKSPEIEDVVSKGDKKIQAVLKNGTQVDFRTITPKAIGSMMQYFTGSKQHNVLLRTYALDRGFSLSEYGIKDKAGKLHEFADEESFYNFLGLDYIPPELRWGKNEIDLAHKHKLPKLIELSDIKGDIHTHTIFSDGVNTLPEMINAAKKLGYQYYGVADHAPSEQSRGRDIVAKIISDRTDEIAKINSSQNEIKVFYGYEVNILANGKLGLADELLKQLDYVIASIHTSFTQDRVTVTNRLISAIENPYVKIIGHPSGRLINERDACDIDWKKVFDACVANNKILEINAQPNRLDLADDLVRDALELGVKFIINTDAHDTSSLNLMKYGIDVARRGGCEIKDIVNTLDLKKFSEVILKS